MNFFNWTAITLLLVATFQPLYSEGPLPDRKITSAIFTGEMLTKEADAFWEKFIESRLFEQGREGEIGKQLKMLAHPYEKIPLVEELIKSKLKDFQAHGGSLDSFLIEAANQSAEFQKFLSFSEPLGELKADLFGWHCVLAKLAVESTHIKYISSLAYPLPFQHLFDFEQETGLVLFGSRLLETELRNAGLLILYLEITSEQDWWKPYWDSPEMATIYFWGPQFAFLKRLAECVSKGQYPEMKRRVVRAVMKGYFNPALNEKLPLKDEACDPLVHMLPHIIQFVPIEDFKEYIQARFGHLDPWEMEAVWVDLHFRKIEALADTDPTQALELLQETEIEIEENLWAYPFSYNYFSWESKRAEALERLGKWKGKLLVRERKVN